MLLAYTKLELQRALVVSDVPDDPYLAADFVVYFPPSLRTGFDDALASHPLRREIVATVVANAVVNRAGISFLSACATRPGSRSRCWRVRTSSRRDVFDAADTWAAVDALDLAVPASVQDEMFLVVRRLVERAARWLVRHSEALVLGPTVERFRPGVRAVVAELPELLVGAVGETAEATAARFTAAGVAPELARKVAASDAAPASRSPPHPSRSTTTSTHQPRSRRSNSCSTIAWDSIASATASPPCPEPTAGRPRPVPRSATTSTSRSTRSPAPSSPRPTPTDRPTAASTPGSTTTPTR